MEVVGSRLRHLNGELNHFYRIIALATSIYNTNDLASWCGINENFVFHFSSSSRPAALEIEIRGIDVTNFNEKTVTDTRFVQTALIDQYDIGGRKLLIFVSNRNRARSVALELLKTAAHTGNHDRFLLSSRAYLTKFIADIGDPALRYSLSFGIGYIYDTQPNREKSIVETLFQDGVIQVLVSTVNLCWVISDAPSVVILIGTQNDDGSEYLLSDVLQMVAIAKNFCVLLCHHKQKNYYARCLLEPITVESQIVGNLHDHITSEIVAGIIVNKQEAIDYLTWTFFYRRLHLNPNYYGLNQNTDRHISDYLSELVETTLEDLSHSGCVQIKSNDFDTVPNDFGRVASHYYIKYTTVEIYKASLRPKTRQKGLLEIICSSRELENLTTRPGEDFIICKILSTIPSLSHPRMSYEYQKKSLALMIAHFSRLTLTGELLSDRINILSIVTKLNFALVDVCASLGYIKPLLCGMQISQMVMQGQWSSDSPFIQAPLITREHADKLIENLNMDSLYDVSSSKRAEMVPYLSQIEMAELMRCCNNYPDIQMKASVLTKSHAKTDVSLKIQLQLRNGIFLAKKKTLQKSSHFFTSKLHDSLSCVETSQCGNCLLRGWWILGVDTNNTLLFLKKVFITPDRPVIHCDIINFTSCEHGPHTVTVHLMSDSYCGCDQAIDVNYFIK
eukprot:gnl/MRDRNA2_/MRDRNA2_86733_c0_seq2.p1 gnl/MRDRNA2_/MRDRNA2_86733_c0~~gnl/MRDRNA2_/MRDRNA2_86733_c0_seq2.p1  ORF type:complete len:675 (+),score=-29.45 gnl/MRDRNA2_/MRDRNA2_86733_c0_seq2:487-2511(+)